MKPAAKDRRRSAVDLPADVVSGLAALTHPPKGWPVDRISQWPIVVAGVTAFAERWDGLARERGWSTLELYALHGVAPWANLAAMGAAFVVAIGGYAVTGISGKGIKVSTRTGSRLRISRRVAPDAVLPWT